MASKINITMDHPIHVPLIALTERHLKDVAVAFEATQTIDAYVHENKSAWHATNEMLQQRAKFEHLDYPFMGLLHELSDLPSCNGSTTTVVAPTTRVGCEASFARVLQAVCEATGSDVDCDASLDDAGLDSSGI